MSVRFPSFARRGLGVGLDLPWDGKTGFGTSPRGDVLAEPVRTYFTRHAHAWSHAFVSWQPRDRAAPRLADYAPAWDDLFSTLPPEVPRALHHTALNLASLVPTDRQPLLDFTSELCERYQLKWVNEDVGFWSVDGRAVPYPLPPLLTDDGLAATIANTQACQRALPVPLVLEFPGFSDGASVVMGRLHAYDFFRRLAEGTDAPVTLDVGHLLSYQWWRGIRGEALFDELERLPLSHCFELHLSGCELVGDRFIDAHHGSLLEEQYALTTRLMERCPNLRAITFEDPRLDERGELTERSARSWHRLQGLVAAWQGKADAPRHESPRPPELTLPPQLRPIEAALGDTLHGGVPDFPAELTVHGEAASVQAVHRMVLERRYRGTGGLREWYPRTLAAWLEAHPTDGALHELVARFCASDEGSRWREHGLGCSLEEAFFLFFERAGIGDPSVREEELLGAVVRALAVTPGARFVHPPQLWPTPAGVVALSQGLVLHAAVNGQYVRGPVTPLIASLLRGESVEFVATRYAVPRAEVTLVHEQLSQRGLLALG